MGDICTQTTPGTQSTFPTYPSPLKYEPLSVTLPYLMGEEDSSGCVLTTCEGTPQRMLAITPAGTRAPFRVVLLLRDISDRTSCCATKGEKSRSLLTALTSAFGIECEVLEVAMPH